MTTINSAMHTACSNFNTSIACDDNTNPYHITNITITPTPHTNEPYIYRVRATIHRISINAGALETTHRIALECTIKADYDANPHTYYDSQVALMHNFDQMFTFTSVKLNIRSYAPGIAPIYIDNATYELIDSIEPDSLLYDVYGDDDSVYTPQSYIPYPHDNTFEHIFVLTHEAISTMYEPEPLDA